MFTYVVVLFSLERLCLLSFQHSYGTGANWCCRVLRLKPLFKRKPDSQIKTHVRHVRSGQVDPNVAGGSLLSFVLNCSHMSCRPLTENMPLLLSSLRCLKVAASISSAGIWHPSLDLCPSLGTWSLYWAPGCRVLVRATRLRDGSSTACRFICSPLSSDRCSGTSDTRANTTTVCFYLKACWRWTLTRIKKKTTSRVKKKFCLVCLALCLF